MMDNDFFKEQTPSSKIKANIVAEYFPKYCRILLKHPQPEIMFLDLYAGPGIYADQNLSTPLLIAKACAEDVNLVNKVRLMFNDNQYSAELQNNFEKHYPKGTFKTDPKFGNLTVGEDEKIKRYLMKPAGKKNNRPTLLFFDPWGYKGIDTIALAKFLEHWGNEIFLFVNIKRIHAAIENDKFDDLMKALFPTSIDELRKKRQYTSSVQERLSLIMDNLAKEYMIATKNKIYHCAFKFQEEDNNATSHFIIHFTKNAKGYELVKQVYHDYDNIGATLEKEGTYTFDAKKMNESASSTLFFGDQNIESLSHQLLEKYKRTSITAKKLFDEHHVNTRYCGSHYLKTLRHMVNTGKVKSTFTDNRAHIVTVLLTDDCKLEFV